MPETPELYRPGEILSPLPELLLSANVTRKDVLTAVEAWEDNPPADKYADILGANSND